MRVLLDTNRLTDALRREPAVTGIVQLASEVFLPFVVLAEIKAGFEGGNQRQRPHNEGLLLHFLQMPSVSGLYPDVETTEVYARLFTQLRRAGTPVPTNDIWIASLAVQHQLTLVTRDEHFGKIPQVSRL